MLLLALACGPLLVADALQVSSLSPASRQSSAAVRGLAASDRRHLASPAASSTSLLWRSHGRGTSEEGGSRGPKDAGWFATFSEDESTYDRDGELEYMKPFPAKLTVYGKDPNSWPKVHVPPAAWYTETESGGPAVAWQTFYPKVEGVNWQTKGNSWRETPEGWVNDYRFRSQAKGPVKGAAWFDSDVAQYDAYGRQRQPGPQDPRRLLAIDGWMERVVNTTINCAEPGCVARTTIHGFDNSTEEAGACRMNLEIHPTDFDGEWDSDETFEYIKANGLIISSCHPGVKGCNNTMGERLYPCLMDYDVSRIIGDSGSIEIEAKITQAVDECPVDGYLLFGVVQVACQVRRIPPEPTGLAQSPGGSLTSALEYLNDLDPAALQAGILDALKQAMDPTGANISEAIDSIGASVDANATGGSDHGVGDVNLTDLFGNVFEQPPLAGNGSSPGLSLGDGTSGGSINTSGATSPANGQRHNFDGLSLGWLSNLFGGSLFGGGSGSGGSGGAPGSRPSDSTSDGTGDPGSLSASIPGMELGAGVSTSGGDDPGSSANGDELLSFDRPFTEWVLPEGPLKDMLGPLQAAVRDQMPGTIAADPAAAGTQLLAGTGNVDVQCAGIGCTANTIVLLNPLIAMVAQNGGTCLLSASFMQTDYDNDHGASEYIEFFEVEDKVLDTNISPGQNPCTSEYAGTPLPPEKLYHLAIANYDVTDMVKVLNSMRISAKNTDQVDECASEGYLLRGAARVDCFAQEGQVAAIAARPPQNTATSAVSSAAALATADQADTQASVALWAPPLTPWYTPVSSVAAAAAAGLAPQVSSAAAAVAAAAGDAPAAAPASTSLDAAALAQRVLDPAGDPLDALVNAPAAASALIPLDAAGAAAPVLTPLDSAADAPAAAPVLIPLDAAGDVTAAAPALTALDAEGDAPAAAPVLTPLDAAADAPAVAPALIPLDAAADASAAAPALTGLDVAGAAPAAAPVLTPLDAAAVAPAAAPALIPLDGEGDVPAAAPALTALDAAGGAPAAPPALTVLDAATGAPPAAPALIPMDAADGAPTAEPALTVLDAEGDAPAAAPALIPLDAADAAPTAAAALTTLDAAGDAPSAALALTPVDAARVALTALDTAGSDLFTSTSSAAAGDATAAVLPLAALDAEAAPLAVSPFGMFPPRAPEALEAA